MKAKKFYSDGFEKRIRFHTVELDAENNPEYDDVKFSKIAEQIEDFIGIVNFEYKLTIELFPNADLKKLNLLVDNSIVNRAIHDIEIARQELTPKEFDIFKRELKARKYGLVRRFKQYNINYNF